MQLSEHFRLIEFTRSSVAQRLNIDNTPPEEAIAAMRRLCENVLEPLRRYVDRPLIITSGYRCERLNQAVGGVPTSQHLKGEAADIRSELSLGELYQGLVDGGLQYDQCGLYASRNFMHLSLAGEGNRQMVFYK